ncbi:MAG: hypothetical protein U1C47_18070 [Hydrogenophaga sp.]|uniref:hypothetical protein n=1 Tax=Hydrogenophaga sp. TaxID=1904254 RepID=UPI002735EA27|nr:hypothetical protein [Hydrogenophaga sp.]MDZ4293818.1 hypothetical protein [Hydrogenophaga sp.]
MFTDSHSVLNAALLLPGTYFLCQALILVIRITLGAAQHPAWRAGAVITAALYTLVLSAHVTPLVHTLSQAPASTSAPDGLVAQGSSSSSSPAKWTQPLPWMHWWTKSEGAQA